MENLKENIFFKFNVKNLFSNKNGEKFTSLPPILSTSDQIRIPSSPQVPKTVSTPYNNLIKEIFQVCGFKHLN